MQWTAVLTALKGASPFDIIMFLVVTFLAYRMGVIEIKSKKKKKENPHALRHVACISDTENLISQKMEIKYHRTMKEQMRVAETGIESALRIFRDRFFNELKSKGYEAAELLNSLDVTHYNSVVEILGRRIHKDVQIMMRENGLAEKSEEVMQLYIDKKMADMQETARKVFNEYYGEGKSLILNRAELFVIHKTFIPEIEKIFSGAIRECRRIAITNKEEIEKIEEKLSELRMSPCPTTGG